MFTDDVDRGITALLPPVNWRFNVWRSRRQNENTFGWICSRYQLPFADFHSPDPSAYCVYRIRAHTTAYDYYWDSIVNAALTVHQEYRMAIFLLLEVCAISFLLVVHAWKRARNARHRARKPRPVLLHVPPAIHAPECDDPSSAEFEAMLLSANDRLRPASTSLPSEQASSRAAYIVPKGHVHATSIQYVGGVCTRPVHTTVGNQHFTPVVLYKDACRSVVWYAPTDDAPPAHTVTHIRGHALLEVSGLVTLVSDGVSHTLPTSAITDIATRLATDHSVHGTLFERVQAFLRSYMRSKDILLPHLDVWTDFTIQRCVQVSYDRYLDGQTTVSPTLWSAIKHKLGWSSGMSIAPFSPSTENWSFPHVEVPAYEVFKRRIVADDGVGTPEKVQPFPDGRSTADAPNNNGGVCGASPNGPERPQFDGAQGAGPSTCTNSTAHHGPPDAGDRQTDLDDSAPAHVPIDADGSPRGNGMESEAGNTRGDQGTRGKLGSEATHVSYDAVCAAVGPRAEVVSAQTIGDNCELYVFRMPSGELRMVLFHPPSGRLAETLHACTQCPAEDSWAKRDGFNAAYRAILGDHPKCMRARQRTRISSSPCLRWSPEAHDEVDIEINENRQVPGPAGRKTERAGKSNHALRKTASEARSQRKSGSRTR